MVMEYCQNVYGKYNGKNGEKLMLKVWFITGCSKGFGKILVEKLLEEGQLVVATARNVADLAVFEQNANALVLPLDVTNRKAVASAVKAAVEHFGRIDVLVNNAGYGLMGAVEECSAEAIQKQFNTNVFGLINLTQLMIPIMRKQKSGHIINISSIAGLIANPGIGIYNASKFALEGLSEALAVEVASFGVKVSLVEPGPFRTNFAGSSLEVSTPMPHYESTVGVTRGLIAKQDGCQPGNPDKAAEAIINLANNPNPPLRLLLGSIALRQLDRKIKQLMRTRDESADIAAACDF